jgi:hypothetical protein
MLTSDRLTSAPGRPPNDTRVCVFGASQFSKHRNGGSFHIDSFPDTTQRGEQAVDLVGHDARGTIVAEHTAALVYAEQVNDNQRAYQLFAGFEERFGHELDVPGRYTLLVDPADVHRLRRHDEGSLLDELETWVRVQRLPDPETLSYASDPVSADLEISVTLYRRRCSPDEAGSLRVALVRSGDAASQTAEPIARAFQDKCPKLAAEKARHANSTTLLVLERHDVRMGNPWELMRMTFGAARELEAVVGEISDAIVWVDTSADIGRSAHEDHWMAYIAKNGSWSAASGGEATPIHQPLPWSLSRLHSAIGVDGNALPLVASE